jgi:hypothetical protein
MTLAGAGRNLAAAGFALFGAASWVMSALGAISSRPGAAFLGVILGGGLVMAGLAVSLLPGQRIRHRRYFKDA